MLINDLIKNVEIVKTNLVSDILDVTSLSHKSGECKSGSVFFSLSGKTQDGADFVSDAVNNGAVLVVTEKRIKKLKVSQIVVKNSRKAMSIMAKNFYFSACDKMRIIGVTGTNGKTTTAHIIAHILKTTGKKVGLIGTNGSFCDGEYIASSLTTPDPIELHELFSHMNKQGIEYVVMEVSAHAIALEKVQGINFEMVVITNITQDHLDFFETMDNYERTKLGFLQSDNTRVVIANFDDEVIRTFCEKMDKPLISYALDNPSDIFAIDAVLTDGKTSFVVNAFDNIFEIETSLIGRFNIQNILSAICVALCMGEKIDDIKKAISTFRGVKGRCDIMKTPRGVLAVIDYAHTPDGIEKVLLSLKASSFGKIIVVFGAGGDRDKKKRPLMGAIVEKYGYFAIITTDNPRSEKAKEIAKDIEKGMTENKHIIIINRRHAIEYALKMAGTNDIVAILGKGSENYIDYGMFKEPYCDYDVVEDVCNEENSASKPKLKKGDDVC